VPALQLRTKVWLERDGRFVIGDGGLQLLLEVEARGSLLAAARRIGWSYRHAWQYLRRAEQAFGAPLVRARPGKGRWRGTVLTDDGRCLLATLREARERLGRATGASGPTREEIAARGRRRARRPRGRGMRATDEPARRAAARPGGSQGGGRARRAARSSARPGRRDRRGPKGPSSQDAPGVLPFRDRSPAPHEAAIQVGTPRRGSTQPTSATYAASRARPKATSTAGLRAGPGRSR
jgi:molybdate transport system regulatory protein